MKKAISIMIMMAITLAVGTAFAWNDDIPYMTNENVYTADLCAKDFSTIEPRIVGVTSDDIPAFYQKAMLRHETVLPGRGVSGMAAGGVCPGEMIGVDRAWESFEKVISPYVESDQLPLR